MIEIAIEVTHQWAQKLPLRYNLLVCMFCGQVRPIGSNLADVKACAQVAAERHGGQSYAEGDFLVVPLTARAGEHSDERPA